MGALEGRVALVAGATRGAGRGIARMLGEAGARVVCTGRSSRTQPATDGHYAGRPETIEETAALVDAEGGSGVAVRVDHRVEEEVESLFAKVAREEGRLDVLVTVLGGPPVTSWDPFWRQPYAAGRALVEGWIWPHILTCRYALPLMVGGGGGLVVVITEHATLEFQYTLFYDLVKTTMVRLAYDVAYEGAAHGITAVALTPGFMRTEGMLDHYGATEENWREVAEQNPDARRMKFSASETPCFVGRAVAALAADPDVRRKSGGLYGSWQLSDEYGFSDVNGDRPHWGRSFAELMASRPAPIARRWEIATGD